MDGTEPQIPPRPDGGSRFDWERIDWTPPPPRRRRRGAALVATFVAAALVAAGIAGGVTATKTIAPKGSSSDYKFLAVIGGKPVRWNPCQPIHYTIDVGAAPDGSIDDVYEAIRRRGASRGRCLDRVRGPRAVCGPDDDRRCLPRPAGSALARGGDLSERDGAIVVRPAGREDVALLIALFGELAEYEQLSDMLRADERRLSEALFCERTFVHCDI